VIACPNCRTQTTTLTLGARDSSRPIEADACAACNLFWFDRLESLRLNPDGVLELFKYIGAASGEARNTLASGFACPRCSKPLAPTQDLQRTTRFTYWRCERDSGQLITFQQFLRQKNFVRTPSAAELAKLRETVRQVSCSQCGAPIDLATDPACPHCGAPIALVDPEGVAKAVRELEAAQGRAPAADPDALRAAVADAHAEAILHLVRMQQNEREPERDLVAVGVAAIAGWLAAKLAS
jgi:hypothetical protein